MLIRNNVQNPLENCCVQQSVAPPFFTGSLGSIKNKTQTAVTNIVNKRIFINLTFRMLVNIHFQSVILILRTVRPEKLQLKKQQLLTANVNIERWL